MAGIEDWLEAQGFVALHGITEARNARQTYLRRHWEGYLKALQDVAAHLEAARESECEVCQEATDETLVEVERPDPDIGGIYEMAHPSCAYEIPPRPTHQDGQQACGVVTRTAR